VGFDRFGVEVALPRSSLAFLVLAPLLTEWFGS